MWEDMAQEIISEIAVSLRCNRPDCHGMIPGVRDLAKQIRRPIFKQVEAGDPVPMMNQRAVEVRLELESLVAALSVEDVAKALEHAEAALRLLHDQQTY